MPTWALAVIVASVAVVAVALALALLAVRRMVLRGDAVLGILEQELRPLVSQTHGLLDDVRTLVREARHEIERLGAVTERVHEATEGLVRLTRAMSGLARLGQVVSFAVGARKGVDVFVHRLWGRRGGDHG